MLERQAWCINAACTQSTISAYPVTGRAVSIRDMHDATRRQEKEFYLLLDEDLYARINAGLIRL
jgi:hypothetical protein